ncbi:MAG: TPM domain-containing protein [Bryobacterales bacterium]|jgi:uncharacterized protein|nr:TPM domain-containing protein [Bryobacterales bacterium]
MFRPATVLGALLLFAASAAGVDWKALKPQGYLSDFAKVVDPASRTELERYCAAVEAQTGAQIALVTLPSTQGEPIEDVADTLLRAWGIGQKNEDNGILLLLAVQDRRSRLEVGYGLEPILPDGFAGEILRGMRPALRQGHYGEAMLAAADLLGTRIAQGKQITLTEQPVRRIRERPADSIPWPLVAGGLLFLLSLAGGGRRGGMHGGGILPGLLMGSMMGRSWRHGHHGGGFGGFDSPGGFGGFGGGSSGGGGASSNW